MNLKPIFVMAGAVSMISAYAGPLRQGTQVFLTFDDHVSSKTAKAGELIHFHVRDDVMNRYGKTVIPAGTRLTGVIASVHGRGHFGTNAKIRIVLNPVDGVFLSPRDKGKIVGGTRTDEAAAASGGAALVFGPLGLVGGYFVTGHNVDIKRGQSLRTEVELAQDK